MRQVLVWNRTAGRAVALAERLRRGGVAAFVVDDLCIAVREADTICCCTRSHAPLLRGVDIRPGTHLDLVGSYTSATREADDEAARRARIFVDRREPAFAGVGDILGPIASGAIREADVLGDLYDLVTGSVVGRQSETEITLFKNAGGGHLDLMTIEAVVEREVREQRGAAALMCVRRCHRASPWNSPCCGLTGPCLPGPVHRAHVCPVTASALGSLTWG